MFRGCRQVSSLSQVLSSAGDTYFFDGRWLYIKLQDPGDPSRDPDVSVQGTTIYGTR